MGTKTKQEQLFTMGTITNNEEYTQLIKRISQDLWNLTHTDDGDLFGEFDLTDTQELIALSLLISKLSARSLNWLAVKYTDYNYETEHNLNPSYQEIYTSITALFYQEIDAILEQVGQIME